MAEGLSQHTVYAIARDSVGFMWFGTEDGLNRFDGREFRVFRHVSGDSASLSSNAVLSVLVDSRGTLWAGTADGVDRFDPITERFLRVGSAADSTRGAPIYALTESDDGRIWAASLGRGLYVLARAPDGANGTSGPGARAPVPEQNHASSAPIAGEPVRVTAYTAPVLDDALFSATACEGSTLWLGTRGGLIRVRTGADPLQATRLPNPVLDRTYAVHCGRDGRMWFATGNGLFLGDTTAADLVRVDLASGSGSAITAYRLLPDGDGGLWMGSYGSGLFHLDASGEVVDHLRADSDGRGIADDRILSLYRDSAGTVWVGTSSAGISRWNPLRQRFTHVRPDPERRDALRSPNVFAAAQTPNGNVWIGTTSGLYRMDESGDFERFGQADGLASEQVQALAAGADGTLYVGTLGGLCELPPDARRFRCTSVPELPSEIVMAVVPDRDGGLWVGTRGGLARRPAGGEEFRFFRHDPSDSSSLSDDDVRSVLQDRAGNVWVGTMNGLNLFDPDGRRFIRYNHDPDDSTSLSNASVWTLMEDRAGRLWVGAFSGLNVLDPSAEVFRRLSEADGLPNSVIYGLLEDDAGDVWVSSNRGLSRVRLDPADAFAAPVIRNFTPDDGLQSFEFNLNARYRLSDGRLLFGGVNGFNIFHPDSIRENRIAPPVVLTGLSVLGQPYARPVSSLSSLRLPHDESFFTISFAALDYVSPQQNRYAYRLEGLDEDWIDAGTRPVAVYTSVPPGHYTFRVRGSNGDGVWNEAGLALPVTITPPYWQTWWFRLLALAFVGVLLGVAYRLRVRRLLAVERMRLRIAGDLHDDVGASLGSIILLSDMVKRSEVLAPSDRRRLDTIGQTAREMSADLREIVWIVNPEHDHMDDLVERLRHVSANLLDGVPHSFDAPQTLAGGRLDMTFRRNVLLAFKEILHNVRKHADASRVSVRVARDEGQLLIRVSDDGRGFDETPGTNGHGLKSLRDRADRLGGHLSIETAPGSGTTVLLRLPINANA